MVSIIPMKQAVMLHNVMRPAISYVLCMYIIVLFVFVTLKIGFELLKEPHTNPNENFFLCRPQVRREKSLVHNSSDYHRQDRFKRFKKHKVTRTTGSLAPKVVNTERWKGGWRSVRKKLIGFSLRFS